MRYVMTAMSRCTSLKTTFTLALAMQCGFFPGHATALIIHARHAARADQQAVEQIEDQVRLALLSADAPTLEKVLADDFLGISANGTLSDKQQYLRRIGKREHQFSRIDVIDRKVRLQSSSAIVVTTAEVSGQLDTVPLSGTFRYTRVYSREAGGIWKLRNFEATRVSSPVTDELHRGTPMAHTSRKPQKQ